MLTLLTIGGGVALILFGVRFLRKGLDRLFGERLPHILQRLAGDRYRAALGGLAVASLTPSSTSTSLLAVQTVRAGHLPPQRMLAVILGADIGLTVMVVLIAFRLDAYAPVLALIGMILFQFGKRRQFRGVGQTTLAVAFIFLGVRTISDAALTIGPGSDAASLIQLAQEHPLLLAGIAAVLAVTLQSATATIALAIGLGGSGLVGVSAVAATVIGANVGTGLTMLMFGYAQTDSRRMAVGTLIMKSAVALPVLLALPLLVDGAGKLSATVGAQAAAIHTGFNVLVLLVFLPWVHHVYRWVEWLIPEAEQAEESDPGATRFIQNEMIEGTAIAIGQAKLEVLRLSRIVREMLDDFWVALRDRDRALAKRVQARDEVVDRLDSQVKRFLTALSGKELDQKDSSDAMRLLRYSNELETIGDVIDKNLAELAMKRVSDDLTFTDAGYAELESFCLKVAENMLIAETAFATGKAELAEQLIRHKHALSLEERRLRDAHFARLAAGEALSHESSSVHLDVLTHLKRINNSVTHVAYAVLPDADDELHRMEATSSRNDTAADLTDAAHSVGLDPSKA